MSKATPYTYKPLPRLKKKQRPSGPRKVTLRYTVDQLGQKTLDRIERYYKNNIQLSAIVQQINGNRTTDSRIGLIDCYTVLYHAAKRETLPLKQRRQFTEFELKISEFVKLFRAWKKGTSTKDILTTVSGSEVGKKRAIASLEHRSKETQQVLELKEEATAKEIFENATLMMVEGRLAYVIYRDEIPEEFLEKYEIENEEVMEEGHAVDAKFPQGEKFPVESERSELDSLVERMESAEQQIETKPPIEQDIQIIDGKPYRHRPHVFEKEEQEFVPQGEEEVLEGLEEAVKTPEEQIEEVATDVVEEKDVGQKLDSLLD